MEPPDRPQGALHLHAASGLESIRDNPPYNARALVILIHSGGWQPRWAVAYPETTYKWFIS